jgi:hypothetical protein
MPSSPVVWLFWVASFNGIRSKLGFTHGRGVADWLAAGCSALVDGVVFWSMFYSKIFSCADMQGAKHSTTPQASQKN